MTQDASLAASPGLDDRPDDRPDDALRSMHTELDAIDEVCVDDRIEVFERLNRVLAQELAALDEV